MCLNDEIDTTDADIGEALKAAERWTNIADRYDRLSEAGTQARLAAMYWRQVANVHRDLADTVERYKRASGEKI